MRVIYTEEQDSILRLLSAVILVFFVSSLLTAVGSLLFPQKASASITRRASDTSMTTGCTSITIDNPAQVGDVVVAHITLGNEPPPNINTPSGWTLIHNNSYHDSLRAAWYYRVIDGSEGSTFAFTLTGTSVYCLGAATAFTGVDTSQVIDNSGNAKSTNSGVGDPVIANSVTTVTNNSMVLVALNSVSYQVGSASFTTIPGMTEEYDQDHEAVPNVHIMQSLNHTEQINAAPTGNKSASGSGTNAWAAYMVALKAASPGPGIPTANMLLFWDGTDHSGNPLPIPEYWSAVTTFDGRFVRGEESVNYGVTGGSATHTHTGSVTVGPPTGNGILNGNQSSARATQTHTHTGTVNVGNANNNPNHRTLRLIKYDFGIPNVIPTGAIVLFDSSPGIPDTEISPGVPLWQRQSSFDNRFVRASSSPNVNGGSDTHTHTLTWSNLSAAVGSVNRTHILNLGEAGADAGHTHTVAATTTATNGTSAADCDAAPVASHCLPPYVQVLLAKVGADTPTLSVGITAMFDGEPGGGWVVRSNPGGPYYQRFMRGGSTYAEPDNPSNLCDPGFGCNTHTHDNAVTTSSNNSGSSNVNSTLSLGTVSRHPHTHTVTAAFNTVSHVPQYFNLVVAEKVNFILSHYRWFEDSNNEDVTDPWSVLDVLENQMIPSLPIRYRPPQEGNELRLRMQILVQNNGLGPNEMQFKLQYKAGTDGVCTTGIWSDVGNFGESEEWTFADSSVPNGTQLTQSRMTTFTSDVLQTYAKSKTPGLNPNAVNVGERMEYDFHIRHNGAPGATQYSFRLVEDSGILLSQYGPNASTPICPTLVTGSTTDQQMRHGNIFQDGYEQGFVWVD